MIQVNLHIYKNYFITFIPQFFYSWMYTAHFRICAFAFFPKNIFLKKKMHRLYAQAQEEL